MQGGWVVGVAEAEFFDADHSEDIEQKNTGVKMGWLTVDRCDCLFRFNHLRHLGALQTQCSHLGICPLSDARLRRGAVLDGRFNPQV